MFFQRFYDDTLAQTSYLIGCAATGEAIVLDPNRDAAQYVRAAAEEGLRITHVTETHIHADFLSGSRELAHLTGAVMYLSDEGGPGWQYAFAKQGEAVLLHDRDHFMVGNIRFDVLHTPVTSAPKCFASWIASEPIPPEAPLIRTFCPRWMFPFASRLVAMTAP